jgi:hypothetical protein
MKNLSAELTQLETEIVNKINAAKQQLALLKSISKTNLISPKAFGLAFLMGFLLTYRHKNNAKKQPISQQLLKLIPKTPLLWWLARH